MLGDMKASIALLSSWALKKVWCPDWVNQLVCSEDTFSVFYCIFYILGTCFLSFLPSSHLLVFTNSKVLCYICFLKGPLTAPLNLRVSDIQSTQVTVHWDPVTRNSIMGELKEYKVCLMWIQWNIIYTCVLIDNNWPCCNYWESPLQIVT